MINLPAGQRRCSVPWEKISRMVAVSPAHNIDCSIWKNVLTDATDGNAARDYALCWQREGRRVRIAHPSRGQDFNEMLTGHSPRNGEDRK